MSTNIILVCVFSHNMLLILDYLLTQSFVHLIALCTQYTQQMWIMDDKKRRSKSKKSTCLEATIIRDFFLSKSKALFKDSDPLEITQLITGLLHVPDLI